MDGTADLAPERALRDVRERDLRELEEREAASAAAIRELAAHVHAAEARLATMLVAFTADGRWNATGDWRSLAHWLVVNCGYTRGDASALQRVVESVSVMPTVMSHALAGEVSLGVVSQAARVVTVENDAQLARVVTNATPTQAARVIADFRAADRRARAAEAADADAGAGVSAGGDVGNGTVDDAFWRTWFDDDGAWNCQGRADAATGALLDEAHRAAAVLAGRSSGDPVAVAGAAVGVDGGDAAREPVVSGRPAARRRPLVGDVLRSLADLVLDAANRAQVRAEGGEHFRVNVLIDLDTLVTGVVGPDTVCRLESGPHVSPDVVRRLAEEGVLQTLWHQRGVPLRLGPEVRFASRHQRRVLRFRDGGCAVPGCGAERHLHAHHVLPHPVGPTDLDNLVLLCSFHHRLIHGGRWRLVAVGGQRFEFYDSSGTLVGNRIAGRSGSDPGEPLGDLRDHPDQQGLGITADTARPANGYDPLTDYARDVWVHALLTAGDPPVNAEFAAAT